MKSDDALAKGLNVHDGKVVYPGVNHAFGDLPYQELASVLA